MRVAMIIDAQRLAFEQRLLNRLGVGLMGEGVSLVRIVPEGLQPQSLDEGERRVALAPRLEAPMRVLPWMRGARVRRLAEALEDAPPDVLYLVGGETWTLGMDLAATLDRPLLIDISSSAMAHAAPRPQSCAFIAGYVAPCQGIAAHAIARFGENMVSVAPMGVSTNRRPRAVFANPDRSAAIGILGGAHEVPAYVALLTGLSEAIKDHPRVEVFLELRGAHEHEVWREVERHGLLGVVSPLGSAAQHRPLLSRCDVIAWPERRGELHSLLLEVMAAAIPVIAACDPSLDMLRDGETARLVKRDDGNEWAENLRAVLTSRESARALGQRGRAHVTAHHQSSEQVTRLLAVVERVGRRTYSFPGGGSAG